MSQSISDENTPNQEPQEAEPTEPTSEPEAPADTLWTEPHVSSQSIFKEIFSAGGKSEEELLQTLYAFATNMGWVDYWAREGFITEVVSSSERRFTHSRRAVLELELA